MKVALTPEPTKLFSLNLVYCFFAPGRNTPEIRVNESASHEMLTPAPDKFSKKNGIE